MNGWMFEALMGTEWPCAHVPEPWLPGLSSERHDGWRLKSLDGKLVALDDFKGKVVFLDFWATYYGPCVNELAGVKHLADVTQRRENCLSAGCSGRRTARPGIPRQAPHRFTHLLVQRRSPRHA